MTSSPQISASEWRWAIAWSLVILLLSCLPYLIAAQAAPEGWIFAGLLANPLDGHSYLAKMEQGEAGHWLFHLTYTPEPHKGAFIFTFYLGLGHLAALTGLEKIWVFHLARLLAGLGLLLVAFHFTARVTAHPGERRLAFILMLTAAGLGWLGAALGAFPIDLWIPEAFVHYSIYANPHFPLALMLMLFVLGQLLAFSDSSSVSSGFPSFYRLGGAGLAGLALSTLLPFSLIVLLVISGIFLIWLGLTWRRWPWPQLWLLLALLLFAAPVLLYQFWVSLANPALAGWSAQNITTTPRLLDLLLGYGLVGLLALLGLILLFRQGVQQMSPGERLVVVWVVSVAVLIYVPFALQRRLIHGLHVPLCLLAAAGLQRSLAASRLLPGYRRLIIGGVVALGMLGTLAVWGIPLLSMAQPPATSPATALLFLRQEEAEALAWLRDQAGPDDVILASSRLGMFIPARTGARAFYGHPFETLAANQKRMQVEAFYRGEIESVSPAPDFIIYGPSERSLGQPQELLRSTPVFSAGEIFIYANKE